MSEAHTLLVFILAPLVAACTTQGPAGLTADESSTSTGDSEDEGCVELSDGDADTPAQIRSCEPHDQDPQLGAEQIEALAAGQLALALDLYHVLRNGSAEDKSFTISPYSLQAAFGMLYAGAVEPARSELESTLHFSLGDAQHGAFNWLNGQLAARNLPGLEDADPVVRGSINRA
jgi:serpin B